MFARIVALLMRLKRKIENGLVILLKSIKGMIEASGSILFINASMEEYLNQSGFFIEMDLFIAQELLILSNQSQKKKKKI